MSGIKAILKSNLGMISGSCKLRGYNGVLREYMPSAEVYKIAENLIESRFPEGAKKALTDDLNQSLQCGAYNQLENLAAELDKGRIYLDDFKRILYHTPIHDWTQIKMTEKGYYNGSNDWHIWDDCSSYNADEIICKVMNDREKFPGLISKGSNDYAMKRLELAKNIGLKREKEMVEWYLKNGLKRIESGGYLHASDMGFSLRNLHREGLLSDYELEVYIQKVENVFEDILSRKKDQIRSEHEKEINEIVNNLKNKLDYSRAIFKKGFEEKEPTGTCSCCFD